MCMLFSFSCALCNVFMSTVQCFHMCTVQGFHVHCAMFSCARSTLITSLKKRINCEIISDYVHEWWDIVCMCKTLKLLLFTNFQFSFLITYNVRFIVHQNPIASAHSCTFMYLLYVHEGTVICVLRIKKNMK